MGLDGTVEAVTMIATDATAKAISPIINSSNGLHSLPCNSSNGLHSPPRNSSSRRSISGSYSSSRDHQDILAGGDHGVFVYIATSPDISMQNIELYLPRH